MRRRSKIFEYLGTEILKVLEEANAPISAAGINFAINTRLNRVIGLSELKTHLNLLIKKKKIVTTTKSKITYYKIKK
jgi:repressor of nif and glnA expression